jgi:hypothetical protein
MTADACSELGPRSLDPDRRFCGAFAELIWDRTSPTDFCNNLDSMQGKKARALAILAGTEAVTSFRFLRVTHDLPCGSGGARRAAHRPSDVRPRAGSSRLRWVARPR